MEGAGGTLHRRLRHRGKKRNSRARGQAGRGSRSRGHTSGGGEVAGWEGDMGARHRGAALSLADRASRFTLLALHRTAGETGEAMRKRPGPYKEFARTTDNGKEFAVRREVAKAHVVLLRAAVPFLGARPNLSAWRTCSTTGRARRWTAGLPRKFSGRGLTREPVPPKRSPAARPARGDGRRPAPCAVASRVGSRSGAASGVRNRRRPGKTGRGTGKIFRRGRGVRYALPAANAPAATAP